MGKGRSHPGVTRRSFIRNAAAGTAASVVGTSLSPSRVLGAVERVNIALIGCGGRGQLNARGLVEAGAAITHLCDLNPGRMERTAEFLGEVQVQKPTQINDMRLILEDRSVDAVIVATPDHWHTPAAVMACQAGKDVYVEKPHAHNVWESHVLNEASRRYGSIVQVGTQNRSGAYNLAAREYIESGKLGKIGIVKVYNLKPGHAFHLGETEPMPQGFDWDTWQGAAPERPWHHAIYEGGWHHFWDYSGGDLLDDGIHQLDLALMVLGDPGLPGRVSCTGGRLIFADDDSEAPDVQVVTYEFKDFVMTFELSWYPRYMRKTTATIRRNDEHPYWTQNATRVELYGSELMMTIGRHGGGWQVTTSGGKVVEQMYGRPCDAEHYQDFLRSVKDRSYPTADIKTAHVSCTMAHMANITHRVGNQSIRIDAQTGKFVDSDEANALLKREYREGYEISGLG